jgi:spermidine/putrescine transport system ATP-binding protein
LKHIQEQVGITFVYVTHDQEEALTMSDEIAVMNKGVIQQLGDPHALYTKPVNHFVADFIGESNFINASVQNIENHHALVAIGNETISATNSQEKLQTGVGAIVTVRPEKVKLFSPGSAPQEALSCKIADVVYIGTDTRYQVTLNDRQNVIIRVQNSSGSGSSEFSRGESAKICWSAEDARILNE